MVLWLNKHSLLALSFLFLGLSVYSQQEPERVSEKDYKDPEQFEKFYKRRKLIAAWQINELKTGALVVKLKTDKLLIDALLKDGNTRLAEQKRLEVLARNINISKAYRNSYKFSKVYFIYSNQYDSLLKGVRSHIFLDTNLTIDPNIVMTESFYLMAETDNLYNSSIGFVPEDSARFEVERGNPSRTNVPIVLKNKYGHQLKRPFPFTEGAGWVLTNKDPKVYISINGIPIPFYIKENGSGKVKEYYMFEGRPMMLTIPKAFTYRWLSVAVENLNNSLESFYRESPKPDATKIALVKPFLY